MRYERSFKLADFFNRQREVIEAAETPFARLAIFVLPVVAPLVPAFMTGLHIFKLMIELFTFEYAEAVSLSVSIIVAFVLELLGYVGAISFIQSLFLWVRKREGHYILPFALNGGAYFFYLLLMYLINVQLGKYFQTPPIINNIVGLLSFITVPTGLLAANHLSQKEEREDDFALRQERRQDSLEKYKIKYSNLPKEEKVTEKSTVTFPKDWRKLRKLLSADDVTKIAKLSADGIRDVAKTYDVDERTVINWRTYAKRELGIL